MATFLCEYLSRSLCLECSSTTTRHFHVLFVAFFVWCSQLAKLNRERAKEKELAVDMNDPFIYSQQSKTSWRIDATKFKDICTTVGAIFIIKKLLVDALNLYMKLNAVAKKEMSSIKCFEKFCNEWGSNLVLTFKSCDMKKHMTEVVSCIVDSEGKELDYSKVPDDVKDFLSEKYAMFIQ